MDGTNLKPGKFIIPQITLAIFPIWIQKTLLGKKKTGLSFTTLLHPWNFQYFQSQMMDPPSSISSNCPWMTIESPMEARYISYLTLSLYPLFSVYCLRFFLSFFFFFFFFFFISYIWLILNFYCFAISLLQKCLMIAQEGLCFFGAIHSACKVFDKCSR